MLKLIVIVWTVSTGNSGGITTTPVVQNLGSLTSAVCQAQAKTLNGKGVGSLNQGELRGFAFCS